jgi:hypothetical protein
MKFLVIFISFAVATFAFAGKKDADKNSTMLGKLGNIDEQSKQAALPADRPTSVTEQSNFNVTCKDSNGKEFRKNENGYDSCLAGIKSQHDMSKLNSGSNKKDKKEANSANFNFKVGE